MRLVQAMLALAVSAGAAEASSIMTIGEDKPVPALAPAPAVSEDAVIGSQPSIVEFGDAALAGGQGATTRAGPLPTVIRGGEVGGAFRGSAPAPTPAEATAPEPARDAGGKSAPLSLDAPTNGPTGDAPATLKPI